MLLDNAIITPFVHNPTKKTFSGCVYDEFGNIIKASLRPFKNTYWKPLNPEYLKFRQNIESYSGTYIYMGHLTSQYGHFLLESLSRFLIFQEKPHFDFLIFHPFIQKLPDFNFTPLKSVFNAFEIDFGKLKICNNAMRLEHLIIPEQGIKINDCAKKEQNWVYDKINSNCLKNIGWFKPRTFDRIYLSRKKFKKNYRSIINEASVEGIFKNFGFKIIYPENLSFCEQVYLCHHASILAGFSGSALHNSLFMNKGSTVINLGTVRDSSGVNINQQICSEISETINLFVPFVGEVVDEKMQIISYDINYLKKWLEETIF